MWQSHSDLADELTEAPCLNTYLVREIGVEHVHSAEFEPQGDCVSASTTMTLNPLTARYELRVEPPANRRVAEVLAEGKRNAFSSFTKRAGPYGLGGPTGSREVLVDQDTHRPRFARFISSLLFVVFTEVDRWCLHGIRPQDRIPVAGTQFAAFFA
jgi:hypothetical protein